VVHAADLPLQVFELLPIPALIGALLGLGTLARGSELTVVRATGISIAYLAGTCLLAGLVLIGVAVVLGEFLGPTLQQTAREQKAFSRFNNVSFGGSGAWVRDGDLILHVAGQSGVTQSAAADPRAVPAARPGRARARGLCQRRRQG
jgi:lipopolysaccharide export system permease protein